jgi:hypothetical protein
MPIKLSLRASRAGVRVASSIKVGAAASSGKPPVNVLPPPPITIGWIPGGLTSNDGWSYGA